MQKFLAFFDHLNKALLYSLVSDFEETERKTKARRGVAANEVQGRALSE
jgi:hypothetical protein